MPAPSVVDPELLAPPHVAAALADPARLAVLERSAMMDSPSEAAFDRWTALAARALRAPVSFVGFCDDRRYYRKSMVGVDRPLSGDAGLAQDSLAQYVIASRRTLALADRAQVEGIPAPPLLAAYDLVAYLTSPIIVQGQVVGSLGVAMREARVWTADDEALLGDLAAAIAAEVALRLAADDLRASNAIIAAHNRIHELIAASAPLPEILTEVVTSIESYDHRLQGSVLLLDPELNTLHHGAAPTLPRSYVAAIDGVVVGPEVGSCGSAAWHGTEVISADLDDDPRWVAYGALTRAHGLRHCWSFPILGADGAVLGAFGVYGTAPRQPSEADCHFLRDAARLAGIAIERHRAVDELVHSATHDPLTGLPNRALLFDRLTQALARSRRSTEALAVLFIDLDRLKLVNDTLGHEVGDELLRRTAQRLAGCVRPGDTVSHFGADQFIVVAEGVEEERATAMAERVIAAVAAPAPDGAARGVMTTASVGVAMARGDDVDARDVLRRAGAAMLVAKDEGGNRQRLGSVEDSGAAGRRLQLESALRGALARGELHLVAQPVARFGSGVVEGLEALLRWTHPELGPVGPDEFVPIAEQMGMIDAIGAWVLREATAQTARLQEQVGRSLALGVNVSPRQLRHPEFAAVVAAALADSGLEAGQLVVEITETALLGSDPATASTLDALRELGAQLVLDDFGTGFSSLSMLKERPIDGIKIDQSFVRGLPADVSSGAIVAAVVGMARALGRSVTAEGIETPEQLAFLQALGCDLAQGYFISRPLPFCDLARWLADRASAP